MAAVTTGGIGGSEAAAESQDLPLSSRSLECAADLVETAARTQWCGIDPHDGLYWSWPKVLLATPRSRQVLAQLHVRSPIDIRALRRAQRPRLAKTLALFTRAGLIAGGAGGSSRLTELARASAKALRDDDAAGQRAWGYPFPVQTRWSSYPANSPNVVVTSFAIDALLHASEQLDESEFADRARGGAEWIVDRLLTRDGHFAYHGYSGALIHNANLLGAAAVWRALGRGELVERAVAATLVAQRPDGSWPYGAASNLGFVDSFHTGYVLSSLFALRDVDPAVDAAIERGAAYWIRRFFDELGRARMWPNRRYPEDGHSAGTAMSTLSLLAVDDPEYRPLLELVATRAINTMTEGGHAVHRRYRWGRTRVQYVRWCDGHMAAGMAAAARALVN